MSNKFAGEIWRPRQTVSRRDFLCRSWNGLGALALAGMLAEELEGSATVVNPLAPRPQHLPRKAKHCIFMFMAGGVSHVDTFDYKPALLKFADKRLPKPEGISGEVAGSLENSDALGMPSKWEFKRFGQTGRYISTLFPHLGECVDDLAFLFGIRVDNNNHGPATLHVNTGSQFPGSASVGSWVNYGLGSLNQNLPGYIVIQDPRGGNVTAGATWGHGFLPAYYQGTRLRSGNSPILDLNLPKGLSRQRQREEFDLLKWLNEQHRDERPGASELEARINAYELAFRMQMEAPQVVDLSKESEQTKRMYGLDDPRTEGFGRQCLLARRLVEKGVRYNLLVHGVENGKNSWDDHSGTEERMPQHAIEVDKPVAALLKDLKQRGLLEETLVVWASEMGRTPFRQPSSDTAAKPGRDHNQNALVMWLAGGDVKGGSTLGETDEFGIAGIHPIPLRNVHATILNLLGLDDDRLRYLYEGRLRQLTDIGGQVLTEVIA